jgi:hypothetical protein
VSGAESTRRNTGSKVLRGNMIDFLAAAVVFVVFTHAASILVATCAVRLLRVFVAGSATQESERRTQASPDDPKPISRGRFRNVEQQS